MARGKTLNYAEHPALLAIVKRRDRYCLGYPPNQWSGPYLLGLTEAFDAVQQVVSPCHITMPDAPMPASVDLGCPIDRVAAVKNDNTPR